MRQLLTPSNAENSPIRTNFATEPGRVGGRAPVIVGEKLDAILAALDDGMSKAAVCRNFGVKRTTLIETLARIDTAPSSGASSP